jgi:hypothetical protein
MAVRPALTSTELTRLAGVTTIRRYMKAVPATVVATALVNQTVFGYGLTQLTVDNTSAGWSNVRPGMTVYVGTTNGGHERGIFRVRKAPGATTLYVAEMGQEDAGLIPQDIAPLNRFENNDYVTILDRYDVWSVLPRIAYPGNAIYEDYDKSVGTYNTTPPPIVNMTINGVPGHYGKFITAANHALTCVVTLTHWTSSSATYAWSYPAGWTSVSGATTATLAATAAPGDYTVTCTVTPNVGEAIVATRHIFICDAANNPPLTHFDLPRSDVRDRQGRRMTFGLYDDELASIPDGAMVHYWEECTWAGAAVDTATTSFSGWVLRQSRHTEPGLRDAELEVISPAHLLSMLQSTSQLVQVVASPSTWQEIVASISSASFMAWYMLSWRAANVLRLFNFTTFSTAATGQRLPAWEIDAASIYDQIAQLATPRGNFGCDSQGQLFFLRHPSMQPHVDRGTTVVTRDTLTSAIYTDVTIEDRKRRMCAQVRGEAFSWDGSAATATPYLSDSPQVPGQGGAPQKLSGQVLDSQTTLNQVTGDYDAYLNNPYPSVQVTILKNRDAYEPAELPFVVVNVPAALSPDGVAWVKNCIPVSVTKRHNADGTADIILTLEAETHGLPGMMVPVPTGITSLYTGDGYPSLDLPPLVVTPIVIDETLPPVVDEPGEPSMKTDGNFALIGLDEGEVHRAYDFVDSTPPTWEDVSPTGTATAITQVLFDPTTNTDRGSYALGNDGTDTYAYHSDDTGAATLVWTEGGDTPGVYTKIAAFKGLAGKVMIYSPHIAGEGGAGTWNITFDFAQDSGGWQVISGGQYANGRWESTCVFTNAWYTRTYIRLNWPSLTSAINTISVLYDASLGTGNPQNTYITIDGNVVVQQNPTLFGTDNVIAKTGLNVVPAYISIYSASDAWTDGSRCNTGYTRIRSVTLTGTGPDPLGEATATVAVSNDYGATWQTPVLVGDSPFGLGGFDAARLGPASIAAALSQVKRATTIGGAYSDQAGAAETATCIVVPWYKIGSTSLTNNSTAPDFLMGGAFGLYKVINGVATDITPVAGGTIEVADAITTWKGKWFAVLLDVGEDRNLYISTNTGVSWTLVGGANGCADARSVRVRRLATTPGQLIIACGSNGVLYYPGSGSALISKGAFSGKTVVSGEFFG